ncbi:mitochondrial tricarboxylate/dicarboxylate carrier protein [Scheffersomyces xylosifermentans]|uniref:mitochondrial tricarboxylate/dicarboxylate carrier protein n=1 Tax=Scheffersomyces xylosifermentans TaxID=1304137 RepID=UPI00315D0A3C
MSSNVPPSENLLTALVSGCTAAAVSSTLTYPLDFIKTQQQLSNSAYMLKWNVPGNYPSSVAQLYRGCSALVLGTVIKNSTRLISYNWSSKVMAIEGHDGSSKTSAPRMVIAGAMSAFIETLWLIPFENIKITMIQNQSLANEIARSADQGLGYDITGSSTRPGSSVGSPSSVTPASAKHHHQKPPSNIFTRQYISPHAYFTSDIISQYKGNKPYSKFQPARTHSPRDNLKIKYNKHPTLTFLGTIKEMYTLKGINAFTAGTFITFTRQVAISTVWLSTYNAARQFIDPHNTEQSWFGHKHTAFQSIALHVFASTAVIAATQPLDVVKSHIQSKNGKSIYKDSLSTAYRLFLEQGPRSLFKGSLPRGIKVLVSGGLTGAVYSYVEGIVTVAGGQTVFAAS